MDNSLEISVGAMNIMDESGHRQVVWDKNNSKEIAAAQKTFDGLVKRGYAGFGARNSGDLKQSIKTFDPTLEEVVMVPRIVGG